MAFHNIRTSVHDSSMVNNPDAAAVARTSGSAKECRPMSPQSLACAAIITHDDMNINVRAYTVHCTMSDDVTWKS